MPQVEVVPLCDFEVGELVFFVVVHLELQDGLSRAILVFEVDPSPDPRPVHNRQEDLNDQRSTHDDKDLHRQSVPVPNSHVHELPHHHRRQNDIEETRDQQLEQQTVFRFGFGLVLFELGQLSDHPF